METSSERPQHIFSWRNKRDSRTIWLKNLLYLELRICNKAFYFVVLVEEAHMAACRFLSPAYLHFRSSCWKAVDVLPIMAMDHRYLIHLVCPEGTHSPIELPHKSPVQVGRIQEMRIIDPRCSRKQGTSVYWALYFQQVGEEAMLPILLFLHCHDLNWPTRLTDRTARVCRVIWVFAVCAYRRYVFWRYCSNVCCACIGIITS